MVFGEDYDVSVNGFGLGEAHQSPGESMSRPLSTPTWAETSKKGLEESPVGGGVILDPKGESYKALAPLDTPPG